ncbi:MAG: hypothetical protein PHV51_01125 [Methanosarcinaceae archaeon]|nr:hypothetical protein [Methanosarcinaceae archaeon]
MPPACWATRKCITSPGPLEPLGFEIQPVQVVRTTFGKKEEIPA